MREENEKNRQEKMEMQRMENERFIQVMQMMMQVQQFKAPPHSPTFYQQRYSHPHYHPYNQTRSPLSSRPGINNTSHLYPDTSKIKLNKLLRVFF